MTHQVPHAVFSKVTVHTLQAGHQTTPKGVIPVLRPNICYPLTGNVAYAAVAFLGLLAHAVCSALARLKGHSSPGPDRTNAC